MGKKQGELTKTERVDHLKNTLMAGRSITIKWYESKFGMSRKTMLRDLRELEKLGIALNVEQLEDGTERHTATVSSRKLMVPYKIEDVMALYFGRNMFNFLEGTSLKKSFNNVFKNIEKQLKNKKDIDSTAKLSKKLYMVQDGPTQFPQGTIEVLDVILPELRYEKTLDIEYKNAKGDLIAGTLHPYNVTTFKRGLYVLGKVPKWGKEVQCLALEDIVSIQPTGELFDYPKDFEPQTYFQNALFINPGKPQKISLLFSKDIAQHVSVRQYHSSQKTTQKRDGRIQMTLEAPVDIELTNWLLSFGPEVKVLSPKKLKDLVKEKLTQALKQY